MEREIKFRYWDTFNAVMVVMDNGLASLFARYEKTFDGENNPVLMQFTGLKDKNGVDIFEGDVIRLDAADEDEYRNGSPYVMFEKGCFAYRYSHWSDDLCIVLYQTANQMLVVGNIYENPELIAKESDDPPHDGKTSEG